MKEILPFKQFMSEPKVSVILFVMMALIPWAVALQTGVMFNVNDDVVNIMLLREVFGAGSADASIFVSSIFTNGLIQLYRINADIPWYSLLVFLSLGIAQLLLLRLIFAAKISLVFRLCLLAITTFTVLRLALFCSFTASAIMLANAALLYGLIMPGTKRVFSRVMVVLLLATGYLLRPGIFPVVLLAFIPAITAAVLSKAITLRSALQYGVMIIAVVGTLYSAEVLLQSDSKAAFKQTNTIRATFSDSAWGAAETGSVATGWSQADYHTVRALWWYLDSDVHSTESFKKFNLANQQKNIFPWTISTLTGSLKLLKHPATLFTIVLFAWLLTGKGIQQPWLWSTIVLAMLCVLLLAGIRFPDRAAYPLFLMLLLAPLTGYKRTKTIPYMFNFIRDVLLLTLLIPIAWFAWTDVQSHRSMLTTNTALSSSLQTSLQGISVDAPDTLFIPLLLRGYSEASFAIPLHWKNLHPTLPSGWLAQSPVRISSLKSAGFNPDQNLVPQLLAQKSVVYYFLAPKNEVNDAVITPFFTYLNNHYGAGAGNAKLVPQLVKRTKVGNHYWWFFHVEKLSSKNSSP